jgi:hypothetical protein
MIYFRNDVARPSDVYPTKFGNYRMEVQFFTNYVHNRDFQIDDDFDNHRSFYSKELSFTDVALNTMDVRT